MLNCALGRAVRSMQKYSDKEKIQKIIDGHSWHNIRQYVFKEKDREKPKEDLLHPIHLDCRVEGDEDDPDSVLRKIPIHGKKPFNILEYLDEIRKEFGPAKTNLIEATYRVQSREKVTNKKVAEELNRSIKTVEKHRSQLQRDEQAWKKLLQIIIS